MMGYYEYMLSLEQEHRAAMLADQEEAQIDEWVPVQRNPHDKTEDEPF